MLYVNNEFKCFSCLGALMKNDKPVVYLAYLKQTRILLGDHFKKHLRVFKLLDC